MLGKKSGFEQINCEKARALLNNANIAIVDIRDALSFEQGHIPGAVHITESNIQDFLKTTDKTKSLLCYCYHGVSSQTAAVFFKKQGFNTVYSLAGGYEQWKTGA